MTVKKPKPDPIAAAASAIGRLGGLARAASLTAAELSDIGKLGGRRPQYRLRTDSQGRERLERRKGDGWVTVPLPYGPVQREAMRRIRGRA